MTRSLLRITLLLILIYSCSEQEGKYKLRLTKSMQNDVEILSSLYRQDDRKLSELQALNSQDDQIVFFNLKSNKIVVAGLKSQDISLGRSKIRIGLIDGNNNGIFNEITEDFLLLTKYGQEHLLIDELFDYVGRFKQINQFKVDNKFYQITAIDEEGDKLEFQSTVSREGKYLIAEYNSLLPRLTVQDDGGKQLPIWSLLNSNKKLLVIIKNEGTPEGAEEQIILQNKDRLSDDLKIILLDKRNHLRSDHSPLVKVYKVGFEICDYALCSSPDSRNMILLVDSKGLIEDQRLVDLEGYFKSEQND